jgi:hypothetical protein
MGDTVTHEVGLQVGISQHGLGGIKVYPYLPDP